MESPIELLAYQRLAETGLSAAELLELPMDEYARVAGRATPTEAALQALDAQYEPPGQPRQEPAPTQTAQPPAADPQGIDVSSLSITQYAQLRGQLGMGGKEYGRGALDGGSTADWIEAARAKGRRHGWQGGNVQEAPQLGRAYVQKEQPPQYRSAADRFATPGNFFGS